MPHNRVVVGANALVLRRIQKVQAPAADATCHKTEVSSMWHVAMAEGAALFRPTMRAPV